MWPLYSNLPKINLIVIILLFTLLQNCDTCHDRQNICVGAMMKNPLKKKVRKWNNANSLPLTSVCLSVGEDLARTRSLGQTLSMRSCSTCPSMHTQRDTHRQTNDNWNTDCCGLAFTPFVSQPHKFSGSLSLWQQLHYLSFLITDPPVELFAIDTEEVLSRMDDTTLDGYGPGCVYVVSCHHAHCDACTLTLLDGVGHLKSDQ